MDPQAIERLTFQHIPEAFFRSALQAVFMAHRVAWERCREEFALTEAENVLGYFRRGKLEGYLRDAAERFGDLSAIVEKADGSGWYHTEIRGGPVVLTENAVQTPCALVDKADFRLTLAESSQLTLWQEERPESTLLFAVLAHSRSVWPSRDLRERYGHLPGSAYLAYPAPSIDHYVHEINLFDRFPDVVAAHLPQEWDSSAQITYLDRARRLAAG